jgi:hypothetical protein
MASATGILPFIYRDDYDKGIHIRPNPPDVSSSQYKRLEIPASHSQNYTILSQHLLLDSTYPHSAQARKGCAKCNERVAVGWYGIPEPHSFDTMKTTLSERACPKLIE